GFLTEAHRIYESLRVNLLMTTGDAPLLPGAAVAYGGVRTSDSSGPIICTSGFTVNGPYGSGLVSAGHCVGSWSWTDRFEEFHGGSLYTMFFRDGERGIGDSAYFTTSLPEPAYFFYKPGWIRSCTDVWGGESCPSMALATQFAVTAAPRTFAFAEQLKLPASLGS